MSELFIILMILAGIFALIQAIRIKDTFARIINAVMAVSVGVSVIPIPQVAIDGHYLYVIGCLLVVLYAFSDSSFNNQKKAILIGMGAIQLASHLFWLMQFPGVGVFSWASILTVLAYIFVVTKEIRAYNFEIGFLTVLMVDALIKSMIVLSGSSLIVPE